MLTKLVRLLVPFLVLFFAAFPTSLQASSRTAAEAQAVDIRAFHLLTPTAGWLWLGEQLYWTTDAGTSWRKITPDSSPAALRAVFFVDSRQGWTLSTRADKAGVPVYALARTTDAGSTWQTQTLALFKPDDPNALARAVYLHFVDAQTGWLVIKRATSSAFSVGTLFKTTDGGRTWTQLAIPLGEPVAFITAQIGWTAGGPAGDQLFRTQDGGRTWVRQQVESSASVRQRYLLPHFDNPREGVLPVVGASSAGTQVTFFRTSDGGQHWQRSALVPVTSERSAGANVALSVLSTNRWLLAVPNRTRLLDASAQGAPKTVESTAGTPANIVTLQMLNADAGWAKAASGNCVRAARAAPRCAQSVQLLRTRTGGRDWQALALPPLPPSAQSAASPAQAYSGQGFDSCYAPTVDQMQNWYANSPYRVWNLYLGGAMLYSGCTRLTAGFVSQLSQQGWQFILTWVGLQAYCTSFAYRMSSDPATAYNQGVSEANAALDAAANLGLTTADKSGVIIYFDMEAFSSSNSNCRSVAASFISGWSGQLRARGNKAGVYGLYTEMTDYVNVTNPPDDIWIAYWNNVPNLFGIPYIDDSLWANNQRLHQYGGGNETWGGVTLNIDSDVIGGDVVTPCYPLSVGANPSAAGYVQVYTTPNCSGPYFAFSSVLVKAVPNDGYLFTGWSGSATGTQNPLTVTMDASKNLTANFLALRFRVFVPLYSIDPGSPGALFRPANKVTH